MSAFVDANGFRPLDLTSEHRVTSSVAEAPSAVTDYAKRQIHRSADPRKRVDETQFGRSWKGETRGSDRPEDEDEGRDQEDWEEDSEAEDLERSLGETRTVEDTVETTISEDLASGYRAKLDSSLKILGQEDLDLVVPGDYLDDAEVHLVANATQDGNHALQDYQMQLMLLEQQNKKRLLMARQEQDGGVTETSSYGANGTHTRQPEFIPTTVVPVSSAMRAQKRPRPTTPTLDSQTTSSFLSKSSALTVDGKHVDEADGSSIPKDDHYPQGGTYGKEARIVEGFPPHVDLLYTISCARSQSHSHPIPAFRDAPQPEVLARIEQDGTSLEQQHMNGTIPVFDLDAYLEDERDDVALVVVRSVECSEACAMMARSGGPLKYVERLYVKSRIAKTVIHRIATCYFQPLHYQNSSKTLERKRLEPADLFLFHHHDALRDCAQTEEDPMVKSQIEGLLEYIDLRYGSEFDEARELFDLDVVDREHILKLFKPNDLILSGNLGQSAAYVLQEWPKPVGDGAVSLLCWSLQNDGARFVRKSSTLTVLPFDLETAQIQELTAYPVAFASPEMQQLILERGKKAWGLRGAMQITYKGWNVEQDRYYPDSRFMVDYRVYNKMHRYARAFDFSKPRNTYPFDKLPAALEDSQEPSELAYMLLPPNIPGFYLNEKKWIDLYVDNVHPVTWNKKAFERLVLPAQTKELVRALVTVRTSQRGVMQGLGVAGKRTDITSGKGNGLIMLLHGGPGTGKTLTGESVAEIAEMPLYRVTCGDIGTNADAVEKYLNTVLYLGKLWNCVLLLDEADVFLEQRSEADLERNSLVSVFLRILEYYDGILILTSNRIGTFDEAFKSRIQVALHYESLTRAPRKKIWQNFIDMLEEDEEDVNLDEIKLHLDDLAEKELNGRQIRNVLTTARQLAIYRNERLDWQHLEQALSVSASFSAYVKRMQGHTDEQKARDSGIR